MRTLITNSESQSERALAKVILLGLDVHADSITVVWQIDGGNTANAKEVGLSSWDGLSKGELAETVWSCYEAGPFGYVLHRQLEAFGMRQPGGVSAKLGGVEHGGEDRQERRAGVVRATGPLRGGQPADLQRGACPDSE